MEDLLVLELAGLKVAVRPLLDGLATFAAGYAHPASPGEAKACDLHVAITQQMIDAERELSTEGEWPDAYLQQLALYRAIAEQAPKHNVFLMHAAVIGFGSKAYAFTAASGTGKSTHLRLWKNAFGDAVQVINGDKPLLRAGGESVTDTNSAGITDVPQAVATSRGAAANSASTPQAVSPAGATSAEPAAPSASTTGIAATTESAPPGANATGIAATTESAAATASATRPAIATEPASVQPSAAATSCSPITVYGTPWSGKEGWQANTSAPLAGLCLLERGSEDVCERIGAQEALSAAMRQVYMPRDGQSAFLTLGFLDTLLGNVPVYRLRCTMAQSAVRASFEAMTGLSFDDHCCEKDRDAPAR